MKSLSLAGFALLCCLGSVCPAFAALQVGDDAPDFELQASDGNTYKLSDFKGKQAVVIAWFPRAFTGGCTAQCKSLKENSQALHQFDVAYFAASTDPLEGPKGNKAFAESLSADFPILSDPSKETAAAYGHYDPEKKSLKRVTIFIGKDGKVLRIDDQVNAKLKDGYGNALAADLQQLGVPQKN